MDKKKIIIIAAVIFGTLVVIGGTVAFFGWRADKESKVEVTIVAGTGVCELSSDNNVSIQPTSTKDSGRIIKLNARQELGQKAIITWNMTINKINGLQDKTFIYELVNTTTGMTYGSGNFESLGEGSTIEFTNVNEQLDFNKEYEFTLYLWIDGENGDNPISMADQDFNFKLNCELKSIDTE